MEFQLNRNNKILEVTIKEIADTSEKSIHISSIELNPAYIGLMEDILNAKKPVDEDDFFMMEKIELTEGDYSCLGLKKEYEMRASALSLSGQNIYCFDLYFGKLVLDKIGNKKKEGNHMVLKNVKMRYLKDAEYIAKEVSGLMGEKADEVEVSVVTGDKIASVTLKNQE